MAFFDLKVQCAICENVIGLNRYQLRKDVWICPMCLKKTQQIGINFLDLRKMEVEDIKGTINHI